VDTRVDASSLIPREHGAYGQLVFPLVTAIAVAGVSSSAVLIALSAVAGFLAHEPLLIVLGRRGVRAKRERGRAAVAVLIVTTTVAIAAGALALLLAPREIRWSFLVPLVPAAILIGSIGFGYEKRAFGEAAAALTFSLIAIPICLASGARIASALSVGIAFAATFVTATLAVRAVILRVRGGGQPRAERVTRLSVLVLCIAIGGALIVTPLRGDMPWTATSATAPGLIAAVWLALRPPSPARLRTVGWTLVATTAATAAILIVGL
jgi:YwiC-like protein